MPSRSPPHLDAGEIAAFCERHKIRWLALFGSALRDDFDDESDVDFLMELEPGTRIGLFALVGIERELAGIVGRDVDLVFPDELSKYIRHRVMQEAKPVYVR